MFVNRQKGATLIVGLVLLLMLTMVGMTGLNVSTMQEKMAGGMRDRQQAFQAAEAALRLGEEFVISTANISTSTFGVIPTQDRAGDVTFWDNYTWSTTAKQPVGSSNEVQGVQIQPYFVVENMAQNTVDTSVSPGDQLDYKSVDAISLYRVTALGIGNDAQVILQSTIQKL